MPYTYSWSTGSTASSISGLLPGIYSVCVMDASGCTDCAVVNIDSSWCSASFYIYPDTNTLHLYWAINTSQASSYATYLWNWGDGNYDTGQYPSHTYAAAGFYTICLTITDTIPNCTSTYCDSIYVSRPAYTERYYVNNELNSIITINVIPPVTTGVNEQQPLQTMTIYPNPATSTLHIAIPGMKNPLPFTIYSMQGNEIYRSQLSGEQTILNLGEFSQGIYILEIKGENGFIRHEKFVKQ
jgi:PKD repeat protein